MFTPKLLQTVGFISVMYLATGCATTNQYASKIFAPHPVSNKDSAQLAVRFLEFDSTDDNEDIVAKIPETKKDTTIVSNLPSTEDPLAKTSNPDGRLPINQGVRSKKTRE